MTQEIKEIDVRDLVLWTENPRDPINPDASDQDVANRAFEDRHSKWSLSKLSDNMGKHYDLSELPTVVYRDGKPVVYDGNRRVILAKLKHGSVIFPKNKSKFLLPEIPIKLPCNVCSEEDGLENVYRKHSSNNGWKWLERDIFVSKYMNQKKSPFLILEESTGLITKYPFLNQGFVRDEIFNETNLNNLGFFIENGKLTSVHSAEEGMQILEDLADKISNQDITTRKRKKRGAVVEVLNDESQSLITKNLSNNNKVNFTIPSSTQESKNSIDESDDLFDEENVGDSEKSESSRRKKRTKENVLKIFGGALTLEMGDVNNLYRDIEHLHEYYVRYKDVLSVRFASLIRMSLRLLCETAGGDRWATYLTNNFKDAKSTLTQDQKTTLSSHSIKEDKIVELLQTGAHNYAASSNLNQTIALSIIIGAILTKTHGKKEN
ncbi:MAG: hypothetical protein K0R25_160 [Rickettsiaceae bacterium]|jgi:hypothetical protein|nr:hypothetical protein [Rickettsiaceae bacterium]